MSINQEFGDARHVPTGISGDYALGHESGSEESRKALLAQQAMFDEMLDRQAAGQTTPDEDQMIAERFSRDVAHNHN